MSKFLLALDQSTATTGYAVFKDQELLTVGHIDPSGSDYLERIVHLRRWLNNIINTLEEDIEVAIEDIQLQQFEPNGTGRQSKDFGVTTYKKLAHVQGAILNLLVARKIKYSIIPSSSWKKTCKIKGQHRNEQKKMAQQFVKETYNIKATQDEADAVCIGYHALKNKGLDWSTF